VDAIGNSRQGRVRRAALAAAGLVGATALPDAALAGDGSFSVLAGSLPGIGIGPSTPAVGDFNGDGDQDLAVANYQSDNVMEGPLGLI
jgi:FG-GAP repeat